MNNVIKSSILICSLILSIFAYAQEQKIDLEKVEKSITSKIKSTVNVFLKEKDYILNIDLKKKRTQISSKKNQILKNHKIQEGDADFVLYHKLGLDPLVDYKSEPQQISGSNFQESLSQVTIEVMTNDRLPKQTIDSIKKVLETTSLNLSIKPTFKFSKIKIEQFEPIIPKEAIKKKPRDYIELASKFSTSIGFILATLIFSIVAIILFSKFSSLQKSQTSAMIDSNKDISQASIAASQETASSPSSSSESQQGAQGVPNEGSASSVEGSTDQEYIQEAIRSSANRFVKYNMDNNNESVTLLKKWINLKAAGSSEALIIIAQEIEPDNLLKMFEKLSVKERNEWKSVISSASNSPNFSLGSNFINQQILENIIVPNDILSSQTQSLLYSLTPTSCAKLITENMNFGPLLMNTLASNFIVKMIPHIDQEIMQELAVTSVNAEIENLKSLDSSLQEKLSQYISSAVPTPFTTKITDILPFVNSGTEEHLFKAYGKTESREKLYNMLRSHIPMKLIFEAPDNILKSILQRMNKDDFLNLILVVEDSLSDKFLNAFAPDGSKKREGINFEIESLRENELHIAKLNKTKSQIEDRFVSFSRRIISSTPALLDDLDEQLEELCNEYSDNSSQRGLHAA